MPPAPAPACSSRILALYPHRRTTGRVALDGYGLVPGSFTAFELRHFAPDLEERLDVIVERSVHKFRPAFVAIVTPRPRSPLARRAFARATALGARVVMVNTDTCRRILLARAPSGYDKLAQVVRAFLPELAGLVHVETAPRAIEIRRRLAPAWMAAAAAVVALIDHVPESAAAIVRGDLPPDSQIPLLIAAAARRADTKKVS